MDGVINICKPEGITSFDVVYKIRKLAHTKKVGHTGTLDPEASGVLPICIGKGTKIVDYVMNGTKEYKALLRLGIVTDTYDRAGQVLSEKPIECTQVEIIAAITSFIGDTKQVPPMYSALKIDGVRLYELARKGIEVERKERDVHIYNIEILEVNIPYISFVVTCAKGTYIRSLCYDIGNILKCGGAMWGLERTKTSVFKKENSIKLEDLTEENIKEHIISIEDALGEYPKIVLPDNFKKQIFNGVPINSEELFKEILADQLYRVYFEDNEFIGLGNLLDSGFKMKKLLFQE